MARKDGLSVACACALIAWCLPFGTASAQALTGEQIPPAKLMAGDTITLRTRLGKDYRNVTLLRVERTFVVVEADGRQHRISCISLDERSRAKLPDWKDFQERNRIRNAYMARIEKDPRFHYDRVFREKMAYENGEFIELEPYSGVVVRVIDRQVLMFRRLARVDRSLSMSGELFVEVPSTEGILEGQKMFFEGLSVSGTFRYTNEEGQTFRYPKRKEVRAISWETFMKLRKSGKDLPKGEPPKGWEP